MRMLILSILMGFGLLAVASSPYKQTLTVKKNTYMQDGTFTGGKAGGGSTLLGVRRAFSKKAQIERVIVDLGDKDAKSTGAEPGYFQASVDAENNRVVLDLAQLRMSAVSEQKLKELFKKSPFVASAEFTLDPEDKAGTLVLNLKRPMQLEVFQLLDRKKSARVVMDLTPARTTTLVKKAKR